MHKTEQRLHLQCALIEKWNLRLLALTEQYILLLRAQTEQ
jgi:hypothetical protein